MEFPAGPRVPQYDRGVAAARRQGLTVRAERHARDFASMPSQGPEFHTGLSVPKLKRLVMTSGSQCLAVRAERHAKDTAFMPAQGHGAAGEVVLKDFPRRGAMLVAHLIEQLIRQADIILFEPGARQLHRRGRKVVFD